MMRAPVLPQTRERLWAVVASRLDSIESGLELVFEGLDCSGGKHGCIDGLARDGTGAPVLLVVALDGDALLLPRIVSAHEFLERVGEALVTAVPEGSFCVGATARVLVIGTEVANASLRALRRLDLPSLEVCRLEPFRLAGAERFAVRRFESGDDASFGESSDRDDVTQYGDSAFDDKLTAEQGEHWQAIVRLCERLDPGVRIDGDRFRRRITWHGRSLGEATNRDGGLSVTTADGSAYSILSKGDVRAYGDLLVRRFAELAGLRSEPVAAPNVVEAPPAPRSTVANRSQPIPEVDTLRSALAESLLSPEEFAALAEPDDRAVPDDSPD